METITAASRDAQPPVPRPAADRDTRPPVLRRPPVPRPTRDDPGQVFVATVRAAAHRFADAAGAATALVAEVVPPARHRRARCRVVLLAVDGTPSDVTFLGAAGSPAGRAPAAFADGIAGWLAGEGVLPGDAGAAPGAVVELPAGRLLR
jgi:hypothetical protein